MITRLALLAIVALFFGACADIPVARTYSLSYQDGDQQIGASVHFDPPPKPKKRKPADDKAVKPLSIAAPAVEVIAAPGAPFDLYTPTSPEALAEVRGEPVVILHQPR